MDVVYSVLTDLMFLVLSSNYQKEFVIVSPAYFLWGKELIKVCFLSIDILEGLYVHNCL